MSTKISDCLKNLIGITPHNCDCDPQPENWEQINDSWSGKYIDNIELGIPLKLSKPCGAGSIWEVMEQIRCEAIEEFLTRYIIELGKRQLKSFEGYDDCFGQPKNNSYLSTCNGDIIGFCINPKSLYKGAVLCLTAGSLCINAPTGESFTIDIIDIKNPDTPLHSVTVSSDGSGNPLPIVGLPVELPLSKNGKPINYAIVYDRNGYKPKDYKFTCGCSGTAKPGYMIHDYFQTQGIQSGSIQSLRHNYTVNKHTHGLLIDFTIKCDAYGWMCTRDRDWWCTSEFGRLAALAIVGLANMKMISYCLSSQNSYTVLNAEQMYNKHQWINKRVDGLMKHISQRSVDDITHCFSCNPALGYKVQSILV